MYDEKSYMEEHISFIPTKNSNQSNRNKMEASKTKKANKKTSQLQSQSNQTPQETIKTMRLMFFSIMIWSVIRGRS